MQKQKWGNAILLPDPVTLHLVPWAGHGEYRVAEVLCESYWIQDRAPQLACPRFVCRQQLARLRAEGFEFKCGFEIEFRLEDSKTGNPVFSRSAMFNHTMVAVQEKLLFDADKHFAKLNINANKIHSEFTPGQYEFTFLPSVGIRGADDPFITKFGLKEMATRIGLNANFMTKPELELFDTSMQFNHSLVSLDGSNAFYDGSAGDNLSDVMRYWIAGLLQHARALKAFCCPSVNCYRRSPSQYTPHKADWGCEDRLCCLRVRNQDEAMTFIENRLCTGLCNPYLVVAAHIAAGLDGISRRLKCPPTAFSDAPVLPSTLSEALVALEEDTLLVEALGREVVDWFVQFKRQVDLTKLKEGNDVMGDPASLQAERDMYAHHLWWFVKLMVICHDLEDMSVF